ncbi:IS3 family transposase [Staphylococcus felis]
MTFYNNTRIKAQLNNSPPTQYRKHTFEIVY